MSGTPLFSTHTTCTSRSPRAEQNAAAPGNADAMIHPSRRLDTTGDKLRQVAPSRIRLR